MARSDPSKKPRPRPWPPTPESAAMLPSSGAKRTGLRPKFSGETNASDESAAMPPSSWVGAIVRNGAKLFVVGSNASLIGTGVINLLISARKAIDKSFAGEAEDLPVLPTSAAYGVYMSISRNLSALADGPGGRPKTPKQQPNRKSGWLAQADLAQKDEEPSQEIDKVRPWRSKPSVQHK
ncbi:protein RETICULATA-RELATED 4, chloroplastic [Sesamum alatum]|uniref:Protein RETICULATA-RELATED 4, chloroplastic n=1 Tax=Sesamum alatum TaxID=300844 RepID=A0AAE2CYL0_9LAMI|nr:protein RETICULATA-RELATED 4, chloroplastic [Sesamum alatum]